MANGKIKGTRPQLEAVRKADAAANGMPSPPSWRIVAEDGTVSYFHPCPACKKRAERHKALRWYCPACGWKADDGGEGCGMSVEDILIDENGVEYYPATATAIEVVNGAKAKAKKDKNDDEKKIAACLVEESA